MWQIGRIAVALCLLIIVILQVDWDQFRSVVASTNVYWLLAAAGSATVDRFWMAGKWLYLLKKLGVRTRMWDVSHHYFTGGLVGLAVQWQLGGDIARVMGLGKKTGAGDTVAASLLAEKLTGAAASAVLALVGLTLLHPYVSDDMLPFYVVAVLVCATTLFLLVLMTSDTGRWLASQVRDFVLQRAKKGISQKLDRAVSAIRYLMALDRTTIAKFFVMTLAEQFIPWLNVVLLAAAFGLSLSFLEVVMIVPVMMFFARLPISVESLGVREGLYVMLFSIAGWTTAEAFATALGARLVEVVVLGLGSLFFVGAGSVFGHAASADTSTT